MTYNRTLKSRLDVNDENLVDHHLCSNARYCGNRAITTRFVGTVSDHVLMCPNCATEHDAIFSPRAGRRS